MTTSKPPFPIRTYSKKELAVRYFPESAPAAAVKTLRRWICRCPPLLARLAAIGYDARARYLTPQQVGIIVEHLGEP